MTAQETFVTRLRRLRERQGIPLDEIAAATRVSRERLDALERGDLSEWPRGVYARAWIRAYAAAVGLDPQETVDEFCRLFPHGDRRVRTTIEGVAAIVAHESTYRDDAAPPHERRGAAAAPPTVPWYRSVALVVQALWMRLLALRTPAPRLKRTPRTSS